MCDETKKVCPACDQEKPLSSFGKNKRYKMGVQSYCRECHNIYNCRRHAAKARQLASGGTRVPDTKICDECHSEKASAEFFFSTHHADGLRPNCRSCFSAKMVARRKQLRESNESHKTKQATWAKRQSLMAQYGLTIEDYERMLDRCGGVCEICHQTETWVGRKNLAVDHCHQTGKIRGLLCSSCNKALGGFKDDESLLQGAIHYLRGESQ